MKSFATLGIVAVLAVATASTAHAQQSATQGLSVRAGMFFPTHSDAKDEGKTWFGVGIERKMGDVAYGMDGGDGFDSSWSLSLDWYGKGGVRSVPLLANFIGRKDQFYYSAGAGISFTRVPTGTGHRSGSELAYAFGVGYDFAQGMTAVFVEFRYFGSAESKVNGTGVFAGMRF